MLTKSWFLCLSFCLLITEQAEFNRFKERQERKQKRLEDHNQKLKATKVTVETLGNWSSKMAQSCYHYHVDSNNLKFVFVFFTIWSSNTIISCVIKLHMYLKESFLEKETQKKKHPNAVKIWHDLWFILLNLMRQCDESMMNKWTIDLIIYLLAMNQLKQWVELIWR